MQAPAISETATPRYGFEPTAMFAATRACAARRAQETSQTAAAADVGARTASERVRGFVAALVGPTRSR